MEACGLSDQGFVGSRFTWCNNRRPSERIWKRLDRVFVNDQWTQRFQSCIVKHVVRTDSNHRPLLMKCHSDQKEFIRYFRFLNFWTEQTDFLEVVQDSWNMNVIGNAMWILQCKLKTVSKNFSQWSRNIIGDVKEQEENIFLNSMPNEDEVREAIFSMNPGSAAGPNGYNGIFFQICWNIVKQNVMDFVA
ncbi:uncharacterized protein [Nicotiana sylvestris]|uniref:uncharacterized protein n=1 Tax=Nicotiana sylvestris TaxID=4096 RepID=UPI00388CA642